MKRNTIINKIINLLSKLKKEEGDLIVGTKPKKPRKPLFTIKNCIIGFIGIWVVFFIFKIIFASVMFNKMLESFESAGANVGFFDEKDTKRYKRKQEELIKIKKAEEERIANEKEAAAKDVILKAKEMYTKYRDEVYSKYIDENGNYLEGVKETEDIKKIIQKHRSNQDELVEILEKCEYKIERNVQGHIKFAKKKRAELRDIKYKIGEYAIKGEVGLSEKEMKELDALVAKVNEIHPMELVITRNKVLFHYFKHNNPTVDDCPCEFTITQLWEELRKDKKFRKDLVPLRLKVNMQEYRFIIWQTSILESLDR